MASMTMTRHDGEVNGSLLAADAMGRGTWAGPRVATLTTSHSIANADWSGALPGANRSGEDSAHLKRALTGLPGRSLLVQSSF
eukprot:CAMPEP_0181217774 /NCGR_PEP_ID=MMETSP1096-20121128/27332_1 /TAXON_ID=156174 ORGANISM="Chrysochromulina ericina, Strain CCMP281" /NCGR_SAMPLE_ID=MMETSP1096 /ASSEMBLY_ACC=CAM_ASM_000453 /LENGTH=82 /DNA_ID=CAMNT_0023309931 /DNA_START=325 /DNA_END=573 /DNA_ORIENTATION=-